MHEAMQLALQGAAWFNTGGRELDFAALRGRAVAVLVFGFDPAGLAAWRALSGLAARLGPGLVCLGVHSATGAASGAVPMEREALRKSLWRFGVSWPVADGVAKDAATEAGLAAPGLILLGPDGAEAWRGQAAQGGALAARVSEWQALGRLRTEPFAFSPEEELRHDAVLHFPEGVAVLERRVFLSDTGADRVVGAYFADDEPIAQVEWVAGGARGFADGPLDRARFDGPRGLCVRPDGSAAYVADSMNNAVRVIDLQGYEVRTLCAGLTMPWDVCCCGGVVYAALPLGNEVVRVDPETCGVAPLLRAYAPLALASAGTRLWVLETGGGLVWCDVLTGAEGRLAVARALPGASGLTVLPDGALCVADQAGNTLWRIDPATGEALALAGKGRGHVDGPRPRFFGPLGMALLSRTLLVADCFNHALRAVSVGDRDGGGGAGSVTLFAAS